jgi:hypothetical protein
MKERITSTISAMLDGECGFDIYVAMKNEDQLIKRFVLDEGKAGTALGFKSRIRESIITTIKNRFLSEESQYASGDDLANEQNCFYVIPQNTDYQPLQFLCTPDEQIANFALNDKNNADALLFKFTVQKNGEIRTLWAYQKIQPASIPNKKRTYFQVRAKSNTHPDVFVELDDQMFIITQSIDLLVLGDEIITNKLNLMERHFGLETFVRASAQRAVTAIKTVKFINNEEKLDAYVQRPNKRYAKKMMQIHKFPVSSMKRSALISQLQTVDRWKNVFELRDGQVFLRGFADVEKLIDLFTERYTKSEITGQEYDTSVKNVAEPIDTSNSPNIETFR